MKGGCILVTLPATDFRTNLSQLVDLNEELLVKMPMLLRIVFASEGGEFRRLLLGGVSVSQWCLSFRNKDCSPHLLCSSISD